MIYHKNCDDISSIIYIFGTFDPDEITLFFQCYIYKWMTANLLNTKYVSLCLAILCLIYQVMSNIMHEDNVSLFKDYWYCLDNSEKHVYINFMSSLLRLHSRY
ncbi:hypothetical protein PHYBLDRAFT_162454 [Phycomyces blakesleeanus NRRL 1555(-)]|uniref:Uncharacterized protein n=1 Tax=Phycomyces blakesleeanus (strain ATCC 8743b / DSM 1359 / FGSC 10004 / NBRC 33097 / NRRL 1555) TaxID=763407 RepID=A0A163BB57_PHYB8|nr:hypothetical protein PHYBLDRAFT_162454 [Phycomyces blakesleeanus NRRL 1555(-)]OAD79381.1 hypothetical protein PHYBLDRAFT_162454 [Phycomyces blakesleeanus NRRL 1555(-)]|eukprot:XP_018297421.1 hypothetical protein PHYBLDRAFT_162454 [Phycomyces blakesleeanus NRRL 1555(-)]